jgi:hypothetical protein
MSLILAGSILLDSTFKLSANLGKLCSFISWHIFLTAVWTQVWAKMHLKRSAPKYIIIIENCQCYLRFSIEPLKGRLQLRHGCVLGGVGCGGAYTVVFASVKMNKAVAVQDLRLFLEVHIHRAELRGISNSGAGSQIIQE